MKLMIFLYRFHFFVTKLAKIVTNNLRFSIFVDTFRKCLQIFNLNRQYIKRLDSLLLLKASVTVDNIDYFSLKVVTYQRSFISNFEPVLESIEQLVQKFISIMLLFSVDRVSVAIEVIQAKIFRYEINSLSKSELIKHILKLSEEIYTILLNLSVNYS